MGVNVSNSVFKQLPVMGVSFDVATVAEANAYICTQAADPTSTSFYVVKPYSEFIERAIRDPKILTYLSGARLRLADGMAICWASVYLYGGGHHWWRIISTGANLIFHPTSAYQFLPEKFAGANATWDLLKRAEDHHLRVFLIGSPRHNDIAKTAKAILNELPQITIAGTASGEIEGLMGLELLAALEAGLEVDTLAEQIELARADLILVGMGFPQQEAVMARLEVRLNHGVMVGEGGTFDYRSFGGRQPKAPKWMQSIGLEWLWRLIIDPRRIVRQLAIPRFIWQVWHNR